MLVTVFCSFFYQCDAGITYAPRLILGSTTLKHKSTCCGTPINTGNHELHWTAVIHTNWWINSARQGIGTHNDVNMQPDHAPMPPCSPHCDRPRPSPPSGQFTDPVDFSTARQSDLSTCWPWLPASAVTDPRSCALLVLGLPLIFYPPVRPLLLVSTGHWSHCNSFLAHAIARYKPQEIRLRNECNGQ